MDWFKKHAILFVLIVSVYISFFISHWKSHKISIQVLGASSNLSLIEEPEDGKQPILDILHSAQREILIEMYLLTDKDIINALAQEREKGVQVQVMLEQHPFGTNAVNDKTRKILEQAHIAVAWTNPAFALTHEKGIVIDDTQAVILNQNLTAASFHKNREFDIIDDNPQDVREVKHIFEADWKRQSFTPIVSHIIESPDTARQVLTNLITKASSAIAIEMEVIEDKEIVNLLIQKAKTTHIRILLADFTKVPANQNAANILQQAGIEVKTIKKPYVHAKMMLVDNAQAYIGSINFSRQSMDDNRELGILILQDDVIQKIINSFEGDWEKADEL